MDNRNLTKEEILSKGKEVIGKTFGELGYYQEKLNKNAKGGLGTFLEEEVFGYSANSDAAPDFEYAGIELKLTPYKKNNNGTYSSKERLVLGIINYMEEYQKNFYESNFWFKNKSLYIMFYLWEAHGIRENMRIMFDLLYEYPEEDLIIIKNDWEIIINKIKLGQAHLISEADTMYLAACTKGANAQSMRTQPFSNTLAKQRAFSLKTSYMTQLLREEINKVKDESFLKAEDVKELTFEQSVVAKLNKYKGKSVLELQNIFNINSTAKNINELIVACILGIKGRVNNTSEFKKANIVLKTIREQKNGFIKESMSFPSFKFTDIVKETWDESSLRNIFETTKFLFVVFKEFNNEYCLDRATFWNMPLDILDNEVVKVWDKTRDVISNGNIVKEVSIGKRKTNFPGVVFNEYVHVRPHGTTVDDVYDLPVVDKVTGSNVYTKHCFWLNSLYVRKIVKE